MALLLVLHIGGLLLLIVSSFAVLWNRRIAVRDQAAPWQRLWRQRWPIGFLLGLLSPWSGFVTYTVRGGWRDVSVGGLPFLTHTDELDGLFLGIFGLQLNFLFWLLVPQFVLWATSRSGRRPARPVHGPETRS